MTILRAVLFCLLALGASVVSSAQTNPTIPVKVSSPNGQIDLLLFDAGATESQVDTSAPASEDLRYAIEFHGKQLMGTARLGLDLVGQPALGPGMQLKSARRESEDEAYTIPIGKTRTVSNHYNGVRADFEDTTGHKLTIEVRAFDDGVAFRYLVPEQKAIKRTRIRQEMTEFTYAKDAVT